MGRGRLSLHNALGACALACMSLAARAEALPVMVNTPELRLDCDDDAKRGVVARVTAAMRARPDVVEVIDLDGVRARFAERAAVVHRLNKGALT